jgi:hypothetical protein
MKVKRTTFLMLALTLLAAVPLAAQDDPPTAGVKERAGLLPREPVVVGRDPQAFRGENTLVGRTTREVRKVADDDLYRRKLALYEGRRFHHNVAGDPDYEAERLSRVYHEGRAPLGMIPARKRHAFGWVGWALAAVIAAVLMTSWKLGWFVPFSQRRRAARAVRTSKAASRKSKGRAPEVPKIELVRYD